MKAKKSIGLYIIIVILCVLVIGLGGYIVYSKLLDKKQESQDVKNNMIEKKEFKVDYPYYITETVKKSNGNIAGYVVCELDTELHEKYNNDMCTDHSTYYYSTSNGKINNIYDSIHYLNDSYLAASNFSNTDISVGVNILNIDTGEIIKKLNYIDIITKTIGGKNYYVAVNSRIDDDYIILNDNFNPIIKDIKSYAYVVNKDNTITLIPNWNDNYLKYNSACSEKLPSKFFIYDLSGNKIYESKEHDHVVGIGRKYSTDYGYGDLMVVDNGTINIIDYKENVIKTLIKANICSVTDNQRVYSEYHFYLDDGLHKYDRNSDKLINVDKGN